MNAKQEGQWFVNQAYAYLSKKHGRRYSYKTPPASDRTNLRKRSGNLLAQLRDSKFAMGNKDWATVGFDIPEYSSNNYLGAHVTVDGTQRTTRITPSMVRNTIGRNGRKYIMIPLRAALNANGTMKPITPRTRLQLRETRFKFSSHLNWGGEDKSKFFPNSIVLYKPTGRGGIPMYVLARGVNIPQRMDLEEAMLHETPKLVTRLEKKLDNI